MSSHDAPPHDTKTGTTAYLACVAWRFWLGELSDKGRRGQRNRFAARSRALRARIFRGYAAPAPGSTKPPCYAGYCLFRKKDCFKRTVFAKNDLHTRSADGNTYVIEQI